MADTYVNTPGTERSDSAAGWAIAAVVVVAIIIGAVLLFRGGLPGVPNTGTDVNVTVPNPTNDSGGTGGTGGTGENMDL